MNFIIAKIGNIDTGVALNSEKSSRKVIKNMCEFLSKGYSYIETHINLNYGGIIHGRTNN